MSEESEIAQKHQYPPQKFSPPGRSVKQPNSFTSTPRSRDSPRKHTSVQRLDLSNEFAQPLLSLELLSQYSSTDLPPSNHVNFGYQNLSQPLPTSSRVLSPNPISPATGSSYVPDSSTSSKYPQASTGMTEHTDNIAASRIQRQLSPTPSGPPEYRSICSSHTDTHIPFAITNKSKRRDNQRLSHQLPSTSGSSPPQAQIAALSISHQSSPPFRHSPSVPNSNQSPSSSKRRSHEPHRASLSGPSPSTSTPNGTRQPPVPASPNVFVPGSHSSSRISPVSPIVQSPNQTRHLDISSDEGALGLSDDYKRKGAPSVPKAAPENFVFPPSRAAAHPKKPSKPKSPKSSIHSLKSNDDNSGRLRIFGGLFKKNKGRNTPPDRRILEESNYEFIVQHEGTRTLKSSYPLDPYNSVLIDKLSQLVLFYLFIYSIQYSYFYLAIAIQANSYRNLTVRVLPVFTIILPLLHRFLILAVDKGKLTLCGPCCGFNY